MSCIKDRDAPRFSWPERWNVAKVTSEISSSAKNACAGAVAGDGIPASDPVTVATKDSPATLKTDTGKAFPDRFPLQAFFVCDIMRLLLKSLI